jgi:hypothetical protein
MFLLENPGGDYGSGAEIEFQGHLKLPPVKHYYWTPNVPEPPDWPRRLEQFETNFYGSYFAYLMWRHQLSNVYITNLIKCRFRLDGSKGTVPTPDAIGEHCTSRFLRREIDAFGPRLVFCFGGKTHEVFLNFCNRNGLKPNAHKLFHPSYIAGRCRVHGRTAQGCVDRNDEDIRSAMQTI